MKASGVEVLGEIPAHWEVRPIRQLGRIMKGVGGSKEDVVEEGVPCVRYGDLYTTHGEAIEAPRTYLAPERAEAYTSIQYGDLLFAASGEKLEEIGKSAVNLIRGDARCGGDMIVLRPATPIVPKYLGYAADAAPSVAQKTMMGRGTTVKHIYPDELRNLTIAIPPLSEQALIADFLDTKTAAIDALIERQERLLALLAEKRQVVITEAVTKGLDLSVPMKDSGVDWIGRVPAHWDVQCIRRVARIESGHTPSRSVPEHWLETNEIPWVSLNDSKWLAAHDYISETAYSINELGLQNSSARLLPARAVVFTRDATIGKAAITTREMAVSQHIIAWLCGPLMSPEYLLRVFYAMEPALERYTFGATLRTIGMDDVRTLVTPVPPPAEQEGIVAQVSSELGRIDELSHRATLMVDRFNEYRQALITAAVTGKLDISAAPVAARASRQPEAAGA